jgi:hypothetical protein
MTNTICENRVVKDVHVALCVQPLMAIPRLAIKTRRELTKGVRATLGRSMEKEPSR